MLFSFQLHEDVDTADPTCLLPGTRAVRLLNRGPHDREEAKSHHEGCRIAQAAARTWAARACSRVPAPERLAACCEGIPHRYHHRGQTHSFDVSSESCIDADRSARVRCDRWPAATR